MTFQTWYSWPRQSAQRCIISQRLGRTSFGAKGTWTGRARMFGSSPVAAYGIALPVEWIAGRLKSCEMNFP